MLSVLRLLSLLHHQGALHSGRPLTGTISGDRDTARLFWAEHSSVRNSPEEQTLATLEGVAEGGHAPKQGMEQPVGSLIKSCERDLDEQKLTLENREFHSNSLRAGLPRAIPRTKSLVPFPGF